MAGDFEIYASKSLSKGGERGSDFHPIFRPNRLLQAEMRPTAGQSINVIPADFAAQASKVIVLSHPALAPRSSRQSAKSADPVLYTRNACTTCSGRSTMNSFVRKIPSIACATRELPLAFACRHNYCLYNYC